VLPLGLFLSPIGGRRLFNQARELCFCCVLGSACNHKLTLEEGDPLNCLISFYASRSQQGGLSWATLLATSGDRPSPSHLLPKIYHISYILGQAMRKKVRRGRKSGNPERARETQVKILLSILGLTRNGCRTS
jgi:hypothetical protein